VKSNQRSLKGISVLRKSIQTDSDQLTKVWQTVMARRIKEVISKIFMYVVAISLSFVFIFPMIYMFSKSLMQSSDVADATVQWIPKMLSFNNYSYAFENLEYWNAFTNSSIIALGGALAQVLVCAIVGYGFARYRFPGYGVCLALVLFTFLVPPQTITVPLYLMMSDIPLFNWRWIDTYYPFIVPGLFGHGLKGSLFVLIFVQFFRRLPAQLEEASRIDGAGAFRTYWTIMLPLARPAMLVVFLFSVVWHWNDVFQPYLYLMTPDHFNLSQNLGILNGDGEKELASSYTGAIGAPPTNENRIMAAAMLTILPIFILYLFTQRYFVESVERTGIAGE
jgi:multiple sugar transport system permease protein